MSTKHILGPDDGKLTIRTRRTGAIAKAGHDLLIEVTSWSATLELGEDPAEAMLSVTADSRSLRVREGTGGIQKLGEDDKANIDQTINDEVLKGCAIEFRSSSVERDGGGMRVHGELELLGTRRPVAFELTLGDDGSVTGETTVRQTGWGMKPYSALFGTLKVADEVRVAFDGRLPAS